MSLMYYFFPNYSVRRVLSYQLPRLCRLLSPGQVHGRNTFKEFPVVPFDDAYINDYIAMRVINVIINNRYINNN